MGSISAPPPADPDDLNIRLDLGTVRMLLDRSDEKLGQEFRRLVVGMVARKDAAGG